MRNEGKPYQKNRSSRKSDAVDLSQVSYGKVPPQAKELEEAILGAIMLDKRMIDDASERLRPHHFYVESHQRIYRAMIDLHSKSQPIDILTVCERLRFTEELEIVGGNYYVTKLTNSVVSSANMSFHISIILDKWMKRELIRIGGQLVSDGFSDTTDVEEMLNQHEKDFTEITSKGTDRAENIDSALVKAMKRIDSLRKNNGEMTGIPSGYAELDRITNGWQPTDLIILAARPAVGKTAFALNLARNAIMHPIKPSKVAFFSLEMSTTQLIQRIMATESEIWLQKIARGQVEDVHMMRIYQKVIQPMANKTLIIDDSPMLSVFELRAKARRLKRKYGIGLIIVDYLQLMSGETNDSRNREREIAQISRSLKALAKELNIPIIALSQLSRAVETRNTAKGAAKTPQLSDLRESGAIEQDADMVMFMYRPEYYDINQNEHGESTKGETHISIAKHRNGDLATGDRAIKLKANLAIQKFSEWDGLDDVKDQLGAGSWRPVKTDSSNELNF